MSTSKAEKNFSTTPSAPKAAQFWLSFDESFGGDAQGLGEKFKDDDDEVQEDDDYDRWVDRDANTEQRQWDRDQDDDVKESGGIGAGRDRAAAGEDEAADGPTGPEWDAGHDDDADAGGGPPVKRRKSKAGAKGKAGGVKGLGAKGRRSEAKARGSGAKGGGSGGKVAVTQPRASGGGDREGAAVVSSSSSSSSSNSSSNSSGDAGPGPAAPSGQADATESRPGDLPTSVDGWVAAQKRLFGHMAPLPLGWIRMVSKSRNVIYFYNVRTGESSGETPTE